MFPVPEGSETTKAFRVLTCACVELSEMSHKQLRKQKSSGFVYSKMMWGKYYINSVLHIIIIAKKLNFELHNM